MITEEKPVSSKESIAIAAPPVGRFAAIKKKLAFRRDAYFFASPALFLIVLFVIFPLLYSFYLTFHNYDLAIGPPAEPLLERSCTSNVLGRCYPGNSLAGDAM